MRRDFSAWMRAVADAAARHTVGEGIYAGQEGALRLARECGPALLDFGDYGIGNIGSTYGAICVIAYRLMPPLDAKVWLEAVRQGYEKALAVYKEQRQSGRTKDDEE